MNYRPVTAGDSERSMLESANRIIAVIIVLAVLAGAVIMLLVAGNVLQPSSLPFNLFRTQLQSVADFSGGAAAAVLAAGIIVALVMLGVLTAELGRRRAHAFEISSGLQGLTTIEEGSVIRLAEEKGAAFHNVRSISCRVREEPGGLVFRCDAALVMGSDVVEAAGELQSRIKNEVEKLTGLSVSGVDIKVRYEPGKSGHMKVR